MLAFRVRRNSRNILHLSMVDIDKRFRIQESFQHIAGDLRDVIVIIIFGRRAHPSGGPGVNTGPSI